MAITATERVVGFWRRVEKPRAVKAEILGDDDARQKNADYPYELKIKLKFETIEVKQRIVCQSLLSNA
jgi:hypothetical protein